MNSSQALTRLNSLYIYPFKLSATHILFIVMIEKDKVEKAGVSDPAFRSLSFLLPLLLFRPVKLMKHLHQCAFFNPRHVTP